MTLFNFGKKKEKTKQPVCACNAKRPDSEAIEIKDNCCSEAENSIRCIKVLGSGCKTCHAQFNNVKKAVAALGLDMEVEYITDMEKVMTYGVMSMPAIVINENVVSMGKLLKPADVEKLLSNLKTSTHDNAC